MIDAGCGTGLVLAEVIGDFAWGIGVDISPEMIRLPGPSRFHRSRFILGDCFELRGVVPQGRGGLFAGRPSLALRRGARGRPLAGGARLACAGGLRCLRFSEQAARALHSHAPENKTWFTPPQACDLARSAGFETASALGGEATSVAPGREALIRRVRLFRDANCPGT